MDRNLAEAVGETKNKGQARKSLWIETSDARMYSNGVYGQARKSLWIETISKGHPKRNHKVRLVRACGSTQEELKVSEWAERVRLVRACGSKLLSLIRSQ